MWELATSPSSSDDGASALPAEAEMQRVDTQPGSAARGGAGGHGGRCDGAGGHGGGDTRDARIG